MVRFQIGLSRLRGLLAVSRVALAVRTAIAAAIAWYLAPFVPFAAAEYSYYAPLGVLVSMYPTLSRSARSGALTLVGLAIGIALGFGGIALTWMGAPGIVALALVVGLGVWLGGIESLDTGRDWIAMAGLFVLLLGGGSPDEYSISYLVTMAFGVLVGLFVNLLLFPPLFLQEAADRLSNLRDAAARHLHDIADATSTNELSEDYLEDVVRDLNQTVEAVSQAVLDADESSRANPRARRRRDARDLNARRLRVLERTVFSIRDLTDVLSRAAGPESVAVPARELLTDAIHRTADLIGEPLESESGPERLEAAAAALERYTTAIDEVTTDTGSKAMPSAVAEDVTAALCLRRMIDASRPLV
ncbi:FUSC family protein [Microbacterium sp. JZ31]|uniref:FUSC family protein n=1 Tax=Microbacterium sp. JZ31 TaxID=1906274 RepID=UPI0019337D28|nr:FUSC family protein [Microbacterium sp. JZ31]